MRTTAYTRGKQIILLSVSFILGFFNTQAQINVTANQTANFLAQKLGGPGVTITNATLTCPSNANGVFTTVSSNLGIDSGIVLTTGNAASPSNPGTSSYGINGPQFVTAGNNANASTNNNAAGDPALTTLAGQTTHDACILEFDLSAQGDSIAFQYVFGSEEYWKSTCAQYNDVFAFFISGPGITGTKNIALVPGTNIPVAVNSINSGTPGINAQNGLTACTAMGPGSPFTQYYVNNANGTTVTYYGFTTLLRAVQAVTPCSSYHLKLAIADASNYIYDSGVFLKANSLKAITFKIDSVGGNTIAGLTHAMVKGCSNSSLRVKRSQTRTTPQTIKFVYQGTAANGTDYGPIADSVIIPANDSVATLNINSLVTPPNGTKTLKIYMLNPYSCSNNYLDSTVINIFDKPYAHILTPDTTVCLGSSVNIRVNGDNFSNYSWSPATYLTPSANVKQPTATPGAVGTFRYILTTTWPGSGCVPIADTINITTSSPVPQIQLGPTQHVCVGSPVNLTVTTTPSSPSFTYSWTGPAGFSSNTQNPSIASIPAAGSGYYVVGVATPLCGVIFDSTQVVVTNPFLHVITPDTSICLGTSIVIHVQGDPNATFSWTPSAGLSASNVMQPIASPAVTTSYIVTSSWTGSGCPPLSDTIKISINPPPPAIQAGATQHVCVGTPVHLSVSVNPANPSLTYTWSGPGGYASNVQNPYIPAIAASGSGTYIIGVATPTCGVIFDSTQIIVTNPFLTLLTPDTTICSGASVNFHVNGDPNASFAWTPATGLNSSSIMQPVATPTVTTTYVVTSSWPGSGCPPMSDTVKVSVNPPPPTIHAGATQHVCVGSTVNLTVAVNPANPSLSYAWSGPGGFVSNVQNPVISAITTGGSGTYVIGVATPTCGTVYDSTSVIVTNPFLTLLTPDTTICSGQAVHMSVIGDPNAVFTWIPGTGLNNANIMMPTATPGTTTKYYVTSSWPGSGCPSITDSVNVSVNPLPVVHAGANQNVCTGATVQLTVSVSPSGTYTYAWTGPAGFNSNQPNPSVTSVTGNWAGAYIVAVSTGACGTILDSTRISVITPFVNILTPDTTICAAIPLLINALGNANQYVWTPSAGLSNPTVLTPIASPTVKTTYVITGITAGCPPVLDTITIDVAPALSAQPGVTQNICSQTDVVLNVNVTPAGGNLSYAWSGPNNYSSTAKSPVIQSIAANASGKYFVVVSNHVCPAIKDSVVINVTPRPQVTVNDEKGCINQQLLLYVTVSPVNINYVYQWTGPASFTSILPTPAIQSASFSNSGTYNVTVTLPGNVCPPATGSFNVTISDAPPAPGVSTDSTYYCQGTLLPALAANGDNLIWYTDTVIAGKGSTTAPVPNTIGVGTHRYFVAQSNGLCEGPVSEIDVFVKHCCGEEPLFIPTAFTPNNDGKNDRFHVIHGPDQTIEYLRIYNRWGQLVFDANKDKIYWDGTLNGVPAEIGVYYYFLRMVCYNGTATEYKGNITLIR